MTEIKFAKVNSNAIIPSKLEENAGYDIYACFDEDFIHIPPHKTQLVPTGIASAFSSDYYFQIEERGSTGSKGIKKSAGVIDSGFRGEWKVAITNVTNQHLFITKLTETETYERFGGVFMKDSLCYPYNKAIAQVVLHKIPKAEIKEIDYEELQNIPSARGVGMLGSSGK